MNEHGNLVMFNPAAEYASRLGIDDDLKFRRNAKTYQEIIAEAAEIGYRDDPYIFVLHGRRSPGSGEFFRRRPRGKRPRIGLNTGAGTKFETKQWPAAHYRKLIRRLCRRAQGRRFSPRRRAGEGVEQVPRKFRPGPCHNTGNEHSLRRVRRLRRGHGPRGELGLAGDAYRHRPGKTRRRPVRPDMSPGDLLSTAGGRSSLPASPAPPATSPPVRTCPA